MKTVSLDLEDIVYLRLTAVAHTRGTTVTALLIEDAYELASVARDSSDFLTLWADGLSDSQIAARTGWTNLRVKQRRTRLNLPANRRTWTTERKSA